MAPRGFLAAAAALLAAPAAAQANLPPGPLAKVVQGAPKLESCGGAEHAFSVQELLFDAAAGAVKAKGRLVQPVAGGEVSASVRLGKAPKGMSAMQRVRRLAGWTFASGKKHREPLCSEGRNASCPLSGAQELTFGFRKLPGTLPAGVIKLNISAVDESGKPVLCIRGSVEVGMASDGGAFRRLMSSHCEDDGQCWGDSCHGETRCDPMRKVCQRHWEDMGCMDREEWMGNSGCAWGRRYEECFPSQEASGSPGALGGVPMALAALATLAAPLL